MWPQDYEITDDILTEWEHTIKQHINTLETEMCLIADTESHQPYTQASPLCGYLQQAVNVLNYACDAIREAKECEANPVGVIDVASQR